MQDNIEDHVQFSVIFLHRDYSLNHGNDLLMLCSDLAVVMVGGSNEGWRVITHEHTKANDNNTLVNKHSSYPGIRFAKKVGVIINKAVGEIRILGQFHQANFHYTNCCLLLLLTIIMLSLNTFTADE